MLLLLVLVGEVTLFLVNFDTRRRAESLIAELQSLKVGVSTLQDAQPILTKYKADKLPGSNCSAPGVGYGILVYNRVDLLGMKHPWLLRLGVRPISFSASLTFVDSRLCNLIYSDRSWIAGSQYPSRDRALTSLDVIELSAETQVEQVDPGMLSANYYDIVYTHALLRSTPWNGRSLKMLVTVTSNTPSAEVQHALAFDLSCFTSLHGCRALCQMMPLASQDALQKHRMEGIGFPENDIGYPGCSLRN